VANAGLGRSDVLAFWFGESDEVTPASNPGQVREVTPLEVRQARESLLRARPSTAHNLGLPELREALRGYVRGLHGDRWAGPRRRHLVGRQRADAGDAAAGGRRRRGGGVVPVWPNLTGAAGDPGRAGDARAAAPDATGAWRSTSTELLAAVTPRTRVLLVNAPNNPTGWTLTAPSSRRCWTHCRRTGTWIVADEVYERLWFGAGPARRASWTSPRRTTGWWWSTASRRAS
jgi:aspartate/methionine/tyrosine aminotransferase